MFCWTCSATTSRSQVADHAKWSARDGHERDQKAATNRLRPGDIVAALTIGVGIAGSDIRPIPINDRINFVAVVAALSATLRHARFRVNLVEPR